MKFIIRRVVGEEQFEAGMPVYGTGTKAAFAETDILKAELVNEKTGEVRFTTGLLEEDIKSNPLINSTEKEIYLKQLKEVKKRVVEKYGESSIEPNNSTFWDKRQSLTINNETLQTFFDTDNIEHAILRQNIIGGGYDAIAPNRTSALSHQKRYYLTEEETEKERTFESSSYKIQAISQLNDIVKTKGSETLLYLVWVLVPVAQGFTKNSSKTAMTEILFEFINGNLNKTDKKKCAKEFFDAYERFKVNREDLITEAIFKAGEHFGLIYFKNGKYITKEHKTTLGSNIEESLTILRHPSNIEELKELKEKVDLKLSK